MTHAADLTQHQLNSSSQEWEKAPGEVISNAVLIKNIKPLQIYVLWKFSRAGLGNLFQNTKFALFDSTFLTTSIMCLVVILGRIKHFRFEVHLGVLLVLTSNCCFCKSLASRSYPVILFPLLISMSRPLASLVDDCSLINTVNSNNTSDFAHILCSVYLVIPI